MHHGRPRAWFALSFSTLLIGCGTGYTGINKTITFYGHPDQVVWAACQDGQGESWRTLEPQAADSTTPSDTVPYRFQIHSEDERYGIAYVTKQKYIDANKVEQQRFNLHVRFLTANDSTEIYHVNFTHGDEKPVTITGKVELNTDHTEASVYTSSGRAVAKPDANAMTYSTPAYPQITDIAAIEYKNSIPQHIVIQRDVDLSKQNTVDIDFKNQSIALKAYKMEFVSSQSINSSVFLKLKRGTTVNVYDNTNKQYFVPESGLIEGDFLQLDFLSQETDRTSVTRGKQMSEFRALDKASDIQHSHEELSKFEKIDARIDGNNFGRFIIGGYKFNETEKNPPLVGYETSLYQVQNRNFNVHILATKNYLKKASGLRTPDFRKIAKYSFDWEFNSEEPIMIKAGAILSTSPKALDVFSYLQKDLTDGARIHKSWITTRVGAP